MSTKIGKDLRTLLRTAEGGGLVVRSGRKHIIVQHRDGRIVTVLPRAGGSANNDMHASARSIARALAG